MITSAGIELKEVGAVLTWGGFSSFVKNRSFDSALWRTSNEDLAEWSTILKTNAILADIYDVLAQMNANMVGLASHKKASRPKPYPRPWLKDKKAKKIGKGALPKNKLREWIENYGKRGRSNA